MYSSFLENFVIPAGDLLTGSRFSAAYAETNAAAEWEPGRLAEFQNAKLRRLIEHAYRNVPYYRELMDREGITPAEIRTVEDLSRFPVLTKKDIRNHAESLRAQNPPAGKILEGTTGGSTGEPLRFLKNSKERICNRAAILAAYGWGGYRPGDKMLIVLLGSLLRLPTSTSDKALHRLMRFRFLPPFQLTRQRVPGYVSLLREFRPDFIFGISSSLFLLARLLQEAGVTGLRLKGAFTQGEMLFPHFRKTIEETFGCRVYDYYGSNEVHPVAFECGHGTGHHILGNHAVVQAGAPSNDPHHPDAMGLILTDLDNYTMPFIRYEVEDFGVLDGEACPCGRPLKRIKTLLGRYCDFICASDGNFLIGKFFVRLIQDLKGIDQVQVYQPARNRLIVRLIKNARFTQAEQDRFLQNIHRYVGEETEIEIEFPENIALSSSGKLRWVVSDVSMDP